MCKIIVIPNASKIQEFDKFSRFCAEILSSMPDGYGFAAYGEKGLFGVRTLSPDSYAFSVDIPNFCETISESFGEVSQVTGAAMFHGRLSTNKIDLVNTHPIEREGWQLIHNGVVTNHGKKYKMNTTNDSEHVLYNLVEGGIDQCAKNLTGYYAGGAIEPNGILHVFRDSIAQLFYAYSEKLESPIFATEVALINEIGEFLEETLISMKVKDNTYLVYKGEELLESRQFKSRGYDAKHAALARRSLGRDIPSSLSSELSDAERDEYLNDSSYNQWEGFRDAPAYREDFYKECISDDSPYDSSLHDDDITDEEWAELYARKYGRTG